MKKRGKELAISLVFASLIFVFGFLGVVSADVNYALNRPIEVKYTAEYNSGSTTYPLINDGDESTAFKVWSAYNDNSHRSIINVTITLDSPTDLNNITFKRYISNGGSSEPTRTVIEKVLIHDSSGWSEIFYTLRSGSFSNTLTRNITGNFIGVDKINVYLYAYIGSSGHTKQNKIYLYEIMAFYNGAATCSDGIQNQGETGIDCGGPCPACAPTPCPENQIIMKLEKPTVALGKLWTGDYIWDICYYNIFGVDGDGNHACQNGNNVLWLSGETGTLASTTQDITYTTPVCYGDLTCTKRERTCNSDEKMVVALFSDTDSHLSDPNYKPDGMVSWWRLENNLQDNAGANDNGVFNGGTATYIDGKVGKALSFDGVDDYVSVPASSSLDLTKFTIESWFKINSLPADQEPGKIILIKGENQANGNSNYGMSIVNDATFGSGAKLICRFETSTDADYRLVFPLADSHTGRFVHVACTLDGNTWKMYIDGQEVTTKIYSGSNEITSLSGQIPSTASAPFYIGAEYRSSVDGDGNNAMNSFSSISIDEIAIYNKALTAEEIQHRYNLGAYVKKICCRSGVSGALTGAYWADMRGTQINNADLNDRVKLMVAGEGMEGRNIDYEIWKDVKFWFDTKVSSSSTLGFTTWRATPSGDYYFKASIDGKVTWLQSGELVVSGIADNSPPVANILTPVVGDIYYTNENIQFTQNSYDVDDNITTRWDFSDTTTSMQYTVSHSYSTTGQKQIRLTVTDDRGLVDTDQTSVLIINLTGAKYVFAHIDYPPWGENIEGYNIRFEGNSSYAIETTACSGTSCTINCLAGGCKTETHPGGQTISNAPASYNNLMFSWTFDAGVSGVNNKAGDEGKAFTWIFGTAGEHTASLEVEYIG